MDAKALQAALFALDSALRIETEDDKIRPADLKRSEIPARRDSRRHADRVPWRGSQGSKNAVQAIYQKPNQYNMARVAKPGTRFTDSPENRTHSRGSFRAC
jgi:hypothetical protein